MSFRREDKAGVWRACYRLISSLERPCKFAVEFPEPSRAKHETGKSDPNQCTELQAASMQPDCIGFTLIIDDIVRPDGTTYMQQLGGGGPQTMFGFQLVSQCLGRTAQLGLAAGVGQDLPAASKAWLTAVGVDVSGLITGQLPTPRAWQLFEEDGTRTQVWRVPECPELYQQLRPRFDDLPVTFTHSRHYHLGIHAAHPPMKLLRSLRAAAHRRGGLLSVETYTCCDEPPPEQQMRELLSVVDIFSPNVDEAASIVGDGTPQQLVERLMGLGGQLVVLRMAEQGVLLAQQQPEGAPVSCQVPAVPDTRVVDVTGCGNAFCGGFLAALDVGLSLRDSGIWGCVAGSIMAEAQGVPTADIQSLLPAAGAKHQQLLACMAAAEEQQTHGSHCCTGRTVSSTAVHGCQPLSTSIMPPSLGARCSQSQSRLFSPRVAPRRSGCTKRNFAFVPAPRAMPGVLRCL